MNKHQIVLLVVSAALVIVIYSLPRVVVENDQNEAINTPTEHTMSMSAVDQERLSIYRDQFTTLFDTKKRTNFADSLAKIFLKYQLTDSSAKYADFIMEMDDTKEAKLLAGTIFLESYQNAQDVEKGALYAARAKTIFQELLEKEPGNNGVKNKLAMALMASENPMQGVMMLRGVLEEEPENREAIFNLGLLAIRSGQYERAETRFVKLLQLNDADHEARFYLAVVYAELGKPKRSIEHFQNYLEYEHADAGLKATAASYIKELQRN